MFFTNLQEEYEYIIDALEYEYKRINELVDKTNTLLFQQNITDDKSKEMIRELEEYLFYLDSFSFYIKRIIEFYWRSKLHPTFLNSNTLIRKLEAFFVEVFH